MNWLRLGKSIISQKNVLSGQNMNRAIWNSTTLKQNLTTSSSFLQQQLRLMGTKISASELKKGDYVEYKGKVCTVAKLQHVTQGQRAAYMQTELVEYPAGKKYNERFRVDQSVMLADLEFVRTEFKEESEDGSKLILSITGDFEEIEVDSSLVEEWRRPYLSEGMKLVLRRLDEKPIALELPKKVEAVVAESQDFQNKTGGYKTVTLENGRDVKVPPHIKTGERIMINMEDESYAEKVQ